MNRKSFFLGIGILFFLAGVATAMVALVRHEPEFYRMASLPPETIQRRSGELITQLFALNNDVKSEEPWSVQFTDESINSYFEGDFVHDPEAQKILPEGISAPRIVIYPEKIRLAFRYGARPWSTIVSIDLKVWLAPKERNVVALELQSLHAGSLPISAQSLLEQISERARLGNIDVTWYRHNGNPVALLRFQAGQHTPNMQLHRLELRQGSIVISGAPIGTMETAMAR